MKRILLIIALGITPVVHSMEPSEAPVPAHRPEVVKVVGAPAQEQLSIQDLIDRKELPEISEDGELDLSDRDLTSLIGLENIPNPEQVTTLDLGENKIVYIQPHAFDRFTNLTSLILTDNPLVQIPLHLFDKLVNLEDLHLEDTFIVAVPPHAFDNLRKLKVLHLFDNKLESLPANALNNLHNLEEFDIQNNKLTALDPNLLSNQLKLEHLSLNNNRLTQLPRITHLTKLKDLSVKANDLTELSPEEIACIRKYHVYFDTPQLLGEIPPYSAGQLIADLENNWQNVLLVPNPDFAGWFDLNLDNRGLTDLSGLPSPLQHLYIYKISARNNFIKRISPEFLVDPATNAQLFPNAYDLDLSNNMIEELSLTRLTNEGMVTEPLRFTNYCPQLRNIDLSNNQITHISRNIFNGLRFLQKLELDDNQINSIEDGSFNDMGNLTDLYLDHNKLHILPRTIFKNLHKLKYLDLAHNSLGNKEQYVFPPKAVNAVFYPQEIPMLKLLAAKKIAAGLEGKNILAVYKALQAIPEELHKAILTAASKNVALKILYANRINWIFNLIAKDPEIINRNIIAGWPTILEGWPKDMQEAILALAPDELRAKLIKLGFGSNIPSLGGHQAIEGVAPEAGEESEEESFEFMNQNPN